jgi:hypothetical protein
MKELLKKIAVSGSGLALIAGTAFASIGNSGTGENSQNRVDFDSSNRTEVETNNHADVDNDLDVIANTGDNEIEGDHQKNHNRCEEDECGGGAAGDMTINTGDADASADVTNRVNRTTVNASMPDMDFGDVGNMDTGKNSENCVDVDMHNSLEVETNNHADVDNDIYVKANTGYNSIESSGRGDATITTGDATASASVVNEVNTTSVTVN